MVVLSAPDRVLEEPPATLLDQLYPGGSSSAPAKRDGHTGANGKPQPSRSVGAFIPAWNPTPGLPEPPGDEETQKALRMYWCPDCHEWTMASIHGHCLFHNHIVRIAGTEGQDTWHGTLTGYGRYRCRCTECVNARRNYDALQRDKRRSAA